MSCGLLRRLNVIGALLALTKLPIDSGSAVCTVLLYSCNLSMITLAWLRVSGVILFQAPFTILISTGNLTQHKRGKGYPKFFFRQIREKTDHSADQTPWPRTWGSQTHRESLLRPSVERSGQREKPRFTLQSADGELADPKTWKENEGYRIPEFLGQSTCILCVNF